MGGKGSKQKQQDNQVVDDAVAAPATGGRHLEHREELEDQHHVMSQKELELEPPVPISGRRCTDCFFCLVFLLYLVGVLVLGIVGFQNGDPQRLVYGSDYMGRTCGDGNMTDSKYLVFPRTQQDILMAGSHVAQNEPWLISFYSVCAEECPQEGDIVCNDEGHGMIADALQARPTSTAGDELDLCVGGFLPSLQCHNFALRKHCWRTLFDTTSILFRCMPTYVYDVEVLESGCVLQSHEYNSFTQQNITTCVKYKEVTRKTTIEPTATDILFDSFNTLSQLLQQYVADVVKCWEVVISCGVIVSVIVGFVYVVSLWLYVGAVVWGSVLGVLAMTVMCTVYLYIKAGLLNAAFITESTALFNAQAAELTSGAAALAHGIDLLNATMLTGNYTPVLVVNGTALLSSVSASESYQVQFANAAYFMTAITAMLTLLILMLRRRIQRAIEIFQEASHAIRANPCLVLLPFVSVPILVGTVAYWTASTAFIASSGSFHVEHLNLTAQVEAGDGAFEVGVFGEFSYVEAFVAFNFIGFLWFTHFISAVVVFIIAGTVGHWYWKGNEEDGGEGARARGGCCGAKPMLRALYIAIRFHLGSAAFGALLVALVQFVRYFAAYVESRSKSFSERNRLMKAVVCCIHCLLKCLEYCVKFISRNAFIIGALYGDSFCSSTKQAFITITSNLAQVALVTFLGDIILRFGQLLVALIACFSCWLWLDTHAEYNYGGSHQLSTFWFPSFLSFMLGWFVANECLAVYDITVDTLLISFCQDQKLKKHAHRRVGDDAEEGEHAEGEEHADKKKKTKKHAKTLKSSTSMAHFIKQQKQKHDDELNAEHAQNMAS